MESLIDFLSELSEFESWKHEHNRAYSNVDQLETKMINFADNNELVKRHNGQEKSWKSK